MKKRLYILFMAFAAIFSACSEKQPRPSVELGVNDTRINISKSQSREDLEFVIPVYSTGDWTAEIVAGGDWLSLDRSQGSGTGYIHCLARVNNTGVPRAVIVKVATSGKSIQIYVVTSSDTFAAEDLADAELNNYLL